MGAPVNHNRIKPKRKRDRKHLAAVSLMPCLVCGGKSEVHHVRTGNAGKDDRRVVPLCADHHRGRFGFHGLGSEEAFFDMHGISLVAEAERLGRNA